MRARVIHDGAHRVVTVIVTGLNRDDVGLLVFVRPDECAPARFGGDRPANDVTSPALPDWFRALLERQYAAGTGSPTRVARLMLMTEPPSIDVGEITDAPLSTSGRCWPTGRPWSRNCMRRRPATTRWCT
ncbi:MAG: hypothetical protein R3E68_05005 [Burkholderiaceae bacterium]